MPEPVQEYPYEHVIDTDAFDRAADRLRLCRQQRRVVYGRVARYSLRQIAGRMRISINTAKKYDTSARERTQSKKAGELVRTVMLLVREMR